MTQAALVVGGGVAGMTAALNLARQGYPVHLVERQTCSAARPDGYSTLIKARTSAGSWRG